LSKSVSAILRRKKNE